MARKAKTPGIIENLLGLLSPRKLANKIGIKPTRLKKIQAGDEKPTKSEISKISHLGKRIPQEEKLKENLKRAKMLDVPKEEISKARKAKSLKDIEDFNKTVSRREYKHQLTQKTLSYADMKSLMNISKYDFDRLVTRRFIRPESIRYGTDGLITGVDKNGIERVFIIERWKSGKHPPRYVTMRRDTLEAYYAFRRGDSFVGSDHWNDPDYEIISAFGVSPSLVA